jgi:CheY-like chemotaxis protein
MQKQAHSDKDASNKLDNINVMVVDGSARSGDLIKTILNQLGFKSVFVAPNGLSGVKLIREAHIDMIFTDWDLFVMTTHATTDDPNPKPEMLPLNGTQFVKRLRYSSHSPNPFVPIVMLLRSANKNDFAKARDAGVNEIVIKPFSADDLCKTVIRIVNEPRRFVTAETYKGPCRRVSKIPLLHGTVERRVREIQLFRSAHHHH